MGVKGIQKGFFGFLVLAVLLTLIPAKTSYAVEGDVNHDGIVNSKDLLVIQENWYEGLGEGDFSGSQSCANCHREIYSKWNQSLHALIYRATDDVRAGVLPDWTGMVSVTDGPISVIGTLDMRGEQQYWVILHFADGDREYEVDRVHGGIPILANEDSRDPNEAGHAKYIGKQRYQTRIDKGYYILPFQWNPIANLDGNNGGWVAYHPEHWADENNNFILNLTTRSEEKRCAGCHQTGVRPTFDEASQQYLHNAQEPNISCENCHGPGGKHISSQLADDIINPGNTADISDVMLQNETCGQCHSRGSSVGELAGSGLSYPYADGRTFRPGDSLADFYNFNSASNHWPDGTSQRHHQQYEDYLLSKHFAEGVTCWDCHDPHGTTGNEHDLLFSARDNTLCVRCHDPAEYADVSHTNHEAPTDMNGAPRCVDCHMPPVQKSGVRYDIHAHTFAVMTPQDTLDFQNEDMGVPNSCAICHRSENGATDTNIARWNDPEDITIATYLDGFFDTWYGDPPPPEPTPNPSATYLGSEACLGCHTNSAIVNDTAPADNWLASLHSAIYRDPDSPDAEYLQDPAEWTGDVSVTSGAISVTATLEIRNTSDRWFVIHFAGGDREYQVDRVHGGKAIPTNADPRDPTRAGGTEYIGKQRYHTIIGDSYYILPFQYNPWPNLDGKNQEWVAYHPEHWADADNNYVLNLTTRSEEKRCAGCHQQGVNPSLTFNVVEDATQFLSNAVQPNIGCENCHGPGSDHPAMIGNATGERGIILPSLLRNTDRRLESCGQCHTRGSSVGTVDGQNVSYPYNGERTYIPGDVLDDFYIDGGGDRPDGTSVQHHQQYNDYKLSKHWTAGKLDCWACHDPHGTDLEHDLKVTARDNSLCLQCHEGMDSEDHTHHGASGNDNDNPRCVDCHMAAVQKSGVRWDIHAHTFDVLLPDQTIALQDVASGQINACALCHRSIDGFEDTNIAVWNEPADISIATILDGFVKQWWPGSLAKKKQYTGTVINVITREEDLQD